MATKKASGTVKKPAAKKKSTTKAKPSSKKSKVMPLRSEAAHAVQGDNSNINLPLVEIFDEYDVLEQQKKAISKQQRDLRAKAKTEHIIASNVFMHQVKLRKMEQAARAEFEQGIEDLNGQLGYQFSLALIGEAGEDAEGDDAAREAEEAARSA